jgi:hypothetical protein
MADALDLADELPVRADAAIAEARLLAEKNCGQRQGIDRCPDASHALPRDIRPGEPGESDD